MPKCPCLIADEPCHERCSCRQPYSSFACWCCAQYGSPAQRKAAARMIVAACRDAMRERREEWNRNIADGHPERNVNA